MQKDQMSPPEVASASADAEAVLTQVYDLLSKPNENRSRGTHAG